MLDYIMVIKDMNKLINKKQFKEIKMWLIVSSVLLACYYIYYFTTCFEKKTIQIDDEFYFMSKNNGKNLIMDTNNKIYQIANVIPLLHFKASEMLGQLKPGNTYTVSGFGTRIPVLNMFPIITKLH